MRIFTHNNPEHSLSQAGGISRTPCEKTRKPLDRPRSLKRQLSSPDKMRYREKTTSRERTGAQLSTFGIIAIEGPEKNADLKEPAIISPHKKSFSQPGYLVKSRANSKVKIEEAMKKPPFPPPRPTSNKRQGRPDQPLSISTGVPSTTSAMIPASVLSEKMAILSQGGSTNAVPRRPRPQTGRVESSG